MLMPVSGCNADEAFAMLRLCSGNANIKLNDIAHRLVEKFASQLHGSDDSQAAIRTLLEGLKAAPRSRSGELTSA